MEKKILYRILIPYDGSRHSKKALNTAIGISDKKSKIFLFTVVSQDYIRPPGGLLGLVGQSSKSISQKLLNNAKKRATQNILKEIELHKNKKIKIDYAVDVGNSSEKILNFARRKKITLIVIGSKGLHGVSKLKILGSTSRKISEYANCPVLIIR